MKKLLLFFLVMTAVVSYGWAQQVVSGTVKSAEDGVTLPGVAIVIVGTTQGTVTDGDGNYRLEVPSGARLKFSYVGYQSQEIDVGNQSVINISMAADITELSEIVVTALSIEKDTKALGYSVSSVTGDKFNQARENNLANALEGRIAGVNVSRTATGPAGSSRVIIRGNKSLQGNNQPLYVVDGIPMDNSNFGQAGLWGGVDQGDGMASIDPENIESITVLKGANASALYGARAANGVINIVTKKGKARKGIGIEFNSNLVFEDWYDMTDLQTKYGNGWIASDGVVHRTTNATDAYNTFSGWGQELDGTPVVQFDGVSRPYSLVGIKKNFKDYLETGQSWTNSIALTGGSDRQNFRVGLSKMNSTYIIPNSGFDRTNVSLSTNSKFGQKVTLVAKVLYSNEFAKNRPMVSDSPGNGIQQLWFYPNDLSVLNAKGDPDKLGAIPLDADPSLLTIWGKVPGEEYQERNNPWGQNPYWTAYQFIRNDKRDRIITSGQLRYDITDFLFIQGQVGLDWYTRRFTSLVPEGTGYQRGGSRNEGEQRVYEINTDWMLGFDKTFGNFSVNAFVGGNKMERGYESMQINGNGFNVQFVPSIANTKTRTWSYGYDKNGINSLYGSAQFGYNNYLFLSATLRNDWFSVLNPENNSIPYPSIGLSWVFSEMLSTPDWLTSGRIRGSWAQVGSVTIGPYDVNNTYSIRGDSHLGRTMASFSAAGSQMGRIPNPGIQPPTSTELEVGLELHFLDNRLGLDFTYYSQRTTDDILRATISPASGFASTDVNVGELKNSGIEVLLTGQPLRGALTWDVTFNAAHNANEVVALIAGTDELVLDEPRTRNIFVKHIVGQPYGMLTARRPLRDPNGNLVYSDAGVLQVTPGYEIIGNGVPDFTGGLENSFTFKNFNLSFLIDFKFGGDIFSGTNQRLVGSGLHKKTLAGRAGEAPLHVKGVVNTGTTDSPVYVPIDRDLTPNEARTYWSRLNGETTGTAEYFLYDASFIKLRQLTFGYNFPQSILGNTPIQNLNLSFVTRNLWVIMKDTENIDPESTYTNTNSQGLDYFGMPPTRTYGFNLRATF